MVPVVHVLAERDDLQAGRPTAGEPLQQRVGRRATRATARREQLDDHRRRDRRDGSRHQSEKHNYEQRPQSHGRYSMRPPAAATIEALERGHRDFWICLTSRSNPNTFD
jgi:hypothetical protein